MSDEVLHLHQFPAAVAAGWKSYPVRVCGPASAGCRGKPCHRAPTFLVQSMSRGFVSANCSACGGKNALTEAQFRALGLWVACPLCRGRMEATLLNELRGERRLAGNYGFACFPCGRYVLLAHLLPSWDELSAPRASGGT